MPGQAQRHILPCAQLRRHSLSLRIGAHPCFREIYGFSNGGSRTWACWARAKNKNRKVLNSALQTGKSLAHEYDKILKENIASLLLPLTEKYLGIKIKDSRELKDKLQTTIEKEPDFIRIVRTDQEEEFILHIEFQTQDEEGMIYRMQEYYGLLRRKHQLPVRQFVIYLGQKPSRMQTQLVPEEIFTGFTLKSLRDYWYENLLDSQVPEEIILAILSDFNKQKPVEVIRQILSKLKGIGTDEITLRRYIRQLSVLARLRNLTKETQKQIQDMGLTYNITEDYLYQEGLTKGRKQEKEELVVEMLKDGTLTIEKIASLAKVSVERVRQIAQALKK